MGSPDGAHRPDRRPGILLDLAVGSWYLGLTTVYLWPLIIGVDAVVPHSIRDPGLQATVLQNVTQHLLHLDLAHLFDGSFYFPAHLTLAMADAQIGLQPLALPLHLIFGDALLVLNILVIVSFPMTAVAADLLGRYVTHTRVGGVVVGTAFAFSAYRFEHIIHLQLLQSWTIPLAYLGLEMAIREPRRLGPLLWAFAVVAAGWTSLNYLLILAITQPVYLAARFAVSIERGKVVAVLRRLVLPTAIAACLTAGVLVPYIALRMEGYHRTLADTFPFSARPVDYLVPAADSLALHGLYERHPPATGIDERELLPGVLVMGAAIAGAVMAFVRRRVGHLRAIAPWLCVSGLAFLFSFGPYLWPDTIDAPSSTDSLISLPYRFLARPLLLESLRSPARFGVIVLLGMAVVAALAIGRGLARLKIAWLRVAAIAVLMLGLAVEYSVNVPTQRVAWGADLPQTYVWLSRQPAGPVVELPAVGVAVSYYLLASTADGHPRLNGWSGFVPSELTPIAERVTGKSLGTWIAAARRLGAIYLIVHADAIDAATLNGVHSARDEGSLMVVATFGTDEVYQFGSLAVSRPPATPMRPASTGATTLSP